MANDSNEHIPTPKITLHRPSISQSHSWPRLPALALTAPDEQDEEETDNQRLRPKNRLHPLATCDNDDDDSSIISHTSSTASTPENHTVEAHSDDEEKHRRPSTTQHTSADTLVEAAMVQAQAKDRHVRFQDHVAASAALVQQMLRQNPETSNGDTSMTRMATNPTATDHSSSHKSRHDDNDKDSLEEELAPSQPMENSGSVLASLMKLDAQRRHRHEEYLLQQDKKKEKKSTKKAKKTTKKKDRPLSTPSSLDLLTDQDGKKPTRPKLNRPVSWLSTMSTGHHVVPKLDKHQLQRQSAAMSRRSSMDSMCTTASQFEPITLEDRVRITFEIANILQKQDFLKKLAKSLMLYGCPAHRLEYAMRQVSKTLCVDAEYIYLPNVMLMSFFDATTHTTETHFIRQTQTFDMDRLGEIYRLEKLVSHGEVSVDEALSFIDQVSSKPPLYPIWLNPWVYALCSFSGCVMFFGGRWKEGGVAAALAMVFAGYEVMSGRIQSFQPIWEITVCIVIGIVAQGLIKYDFCFTPVAFSAFIVVLPGYGMAIAIQELVSRQLVSGVVRMVYAIIYSFLLGYGISMGSELYQTVDNTPYEASDHCKQAASSSMPMASQSQWFNFLTVPLFALGYCMFVKAKAHRWPTMTFVAACGFVVNYALNRWAHAPSQVLQVAPSFVLGMLGHALTKLTGKMSFDAVLLGIFYLVPSSLGVKAALGLFGNSSSEVGTQGADFALAMIESSIGITVGLFLSTLIFYPRGTQHTPLMTF